MELGAAVPWSGLAWLGVECGVEFAWPAGCFGLLISKFEATSSQVELSMVPVLARGPLAPRLPTDNVYGSVDSLNRSVLVYFDVLQLVCLASVCLASV